MAASPDDGAETTRNNADAEQGGATTIGNQKPKTFAHVATTLMVVRNWLLSRQPEEIAEAERHSAVDIIPSRVSNFDRNSQVCITPAYTVGHGINEGGTVENEHLTQRLLNYSDGVIKMSVDGNSTAYYLWMGVVTVFCFYNLLSVVALASFDTMRDAYSQVWSTCDAIGDSVFLIDLFIESRRRIHIHFKNLPITNFKPSIGYMKDGMVMTDPKQLGLHYIQTKKFLLDMMAVLPTDVIAYIARRHIPLIRLTKLCKCHRIMDFIERTEMRTNFPNAFRIIKLVVTIFVLFHWNGCLYFTISEAYGIADLDCLKKSMDCWVFSFGKIHNPIVPTCDAWKEMDECIFDESNFTAYGVKRSLYQEEMDDFWANRTETIPYINLTKEYILSFYWSALTLTTLGEQPFPIRELQFVFETIVILLGLLLFAIIVGNVGSMVSNMNARKAEYEERLDGVKQFMDYRKVNPDIQARVISWFGYVWRQGLSFDEEAITRSLPPRLHGQLAIHVHLETLKRVQLFQDCEPGLLYELVLKLKLQIYSPNDYICRKGDVGKEMYIVKRGSLNVVSEDGKIVFVTLKEGSVFGELSILDIPGNKNGNKRTAAVRSVGFSDLFVLSKDDLWDALREYPDAKVLLLAKGRELLKKDSLLKANAPTESVGPNKTIDQRLGHMETQMLRMERDIDALYRQFEESSANMKQRVTRLERTFKQNRKQIKRDSILGLLPQ